MRVPMGEPLAESSRGEETRPRRGRKERPSQVAAQFRGGASEDGAPTLAPAMRATRGRGATE